MNKNNKTMALNGQNPSTNQRIDYLDGWRGIAILLVLLEHFYRYQWIEVGRLGVDFFFVLSGILMSKVLFINKTPLPKFYKRRISRVFPVFFIYVSLIYFIDFISQSSGEYKNYISTLFFLRSYFPAEPGLWQVQIPIGHFWSLNVEEHSYIILSLFTIIALSQRKLFFAILLLGVSTIFIQYVYYHYPEIAPPNFHLRTEVRASFILISASYFLVKDKFDKFVPSWLPILTLTFSVICYSPLSLSWSDRWTIAPFLLSFTINHLNRTPTFFKSILAFKPLRYLGILSFSVYIWQQPFFIIGLENNFYDNKIISTLLLLSALLVGVISFYCIENPIRKYLNKYW